jgi:hypothetical protein
MKKAKKDIDDFLRFLTESVPNREPSAFFASRVAHRADLERPVFFFQVSSFARRALPLLVSLCFVTLLLSYVLAPADLQNGSYAELFIEQEELEPVTVEELLSSLIPPDSEEVGP